MAVRIGPTRKRGQIQKHTTGSRRESAFPVGTSSGLSVAGGRGYGSGYSDKSVEDFAIQDGNASIHDDGVWGQNADHNRVVDILHAAHRVLLGLIAYTFRRDALQVHEELEQVAPQASEAEQTALDAVDEHGEAQYEQERLRQQNKDEELQQPSDHPMRSLVGFGLIVLLADLGFLSTANQLFGLSDRLVLGIPYTDELHLSAFGSILALLVLAHFAGTRIREVLHAVMRRMKETVPVKKAELPEPDLVSLGVALGAIGFGVLLLMGTSAVRSDFLAARGVDAQSGAFFEIQLGILMAATAFSIAHAHPYGRAWAASQRRVRDAVALMNGCVAVHADLVGHNNRLIDRDGALLAQAGHHAGISTADVERQAPLYMRRVQLSQPEPVTKRLFDKTTPKPTEYLDKKLLAFLTGITALPTFTRLDTVRVNQRREQHREALQSLREQARKPLRPRQEFNHQLTPSEKKDSKVDIDAAARSTKPPAEAVTGNGGGHE